MLIAPVGSREGGDWMAFLFKLETEGSVPADPPTLAALSLTGGPACAL
jgi:hypothetical protein